MVRIFHHYYQRKKVKGRAKGEEIRQHLVKQEENQSNYICIEYVNPTQLPIWQVNYMITAHMTIVTVYTVNFLYLSLKLKIK